MKSFAIAASAAALMTSAAYADVPSFVSDGQVSVCTTAAFPPLSFKKDPADKAPIGIDIEIADALAKLWGAQTSYVVTEFSGLLPTLGSGRCGMIISGIYINDERRKTYDGARYMKSATVLVTKADNTEISNPDTLSGKTVALEAGTYYREERIDPLNKELAAAGKALLIAQNYPTQQGAYQQVLVGRVDGTLTEEAEGAYRVAGAKDQLKVAYTWQSDFTYGIYMPKGNGDLDKVQAGLKKLRDDGFFTQLAEKYGLNASAFDVDYDS